MSEMHPSVYIIGGLPRTGKTTVANRLAHTLEISSLETDHVRMLFKTTPSSKIRSDSNADIDTVTKKLRPRLECLVESIVTGESNIVINGECIDPYMISHSPYRDNIRSCFIGLDNPESAFERIRSIADSYDWAHRKPDEELKLILEKYAARSRALAKICLELGVPYIDASEDFMQAHKQAYQIMTD